ncbi:MAG: hypothetical protein ACYDEJ_09040 [Desulfitobacteriaceae bacterium]
MAIVKDDIFKLVKILIEEANNQPVTNIPVLPHSRKDKSSSP